jgi:transposase-like protein
VPQESQQGPQKKKRGRPWKYDEAFRQAALERMRSGQNVLALARELGINHTQLYRWRDATLGRTPERRPDSWRQEKSDERQRRRIAELERLAARQALELDFFKGVG